MTRGVMLDIRWNMSPQCPLAEKKAIALQLLPGLHKQKHWQPVNGNDPSPLLRPSEIWVHLCTRRYNKDTDILEIVHKRTTKKIKREEHLSYEERLRELRWSSLKETRLRGISLIPDVLIADGEVKTIVGFFSFVLIDNTRYGKHKLRLGKFHKQCFLTVRIAEHRTGCPENFCILGGNQNLTGYSPEQSALVNAGLSREGGSDDLKRSYSASTIL